MLHLNQLTSNRWHRKFSLLIDEFFRVLASKEKLLSFLFLGGLFVVVFVSSTSFRKLFPWFWCQFQANYRHWVLIEEKILKINNQLWHEQIRRKRAGAESDVVLTILESLMLESMKNWLSFNASRARRCCCRSGARLATEIEKFSAGVVI